MEQSLCELVLRGTITTETALEALELPGPADRAARALGRALARRSLPSRRRPPRACGWQGAEMARATRPRSGRRRSRFRRKPKPEPTDVRSRRSRRPGQPRRPRSGRRRSPSGGSRSRQPRRRQPSGRARAPSAECRACRPAGAARGRAAVLPPFTAAAGSAPMTPPSRQPWPVAPSRPASLRRAPAHSRRLRSPSDAESGPAGSAPLPPVPGRAVAPPSEPESARARPHSR